MYFDIDAHILTLQVRSGLTYTYSLKQTVSLFFNRLKNVPLVLPALPEVDAFYCVEENWYEKFFDKEIVTLVRSCISLNDASYYHHDTFFLSSRVEKCSSFIKGMHFNVYENSQWRIHTLIPLSFFIDLCKKARN